MVEELSQFARVLTGETPEPAPEGAATDEPAPDPEGDQSATGADEPETSPETPPEPTEGPITLTVKDLADKLDIKPAELYSSLQIDVGGKSISLSEFKDRAKDLQRADDMLTDARDHALTSENDLLRKNRALQLAMQQLGRPLTDAEVQRAATIHNEYAREQEALSVAAISDWKDPARQNADYKLIGALLSDYGYTPAESGAIHDHRLVKILRDFSTLTERLKLAGKSEVVTNRPGGKSRRKSAPSTKTAGERFKSGELSSSQAILVAIADGAK